MKTPSPPTPQKPRWTPHGANTALVRESPMPPAPTPVDRGKRILLADDDPGVRGSLSDVLVSEGYVVIPANDGQQALELAASTEVDLVLLDLNMPVKNGWDTFERLTAEHPLVPVIIITARPNQLFTAMGAGVGALVEKPMEIKTLLHTVAQLLAEPARQRLARLAGHATGFLYAAAPRQNPAPPGDGSS
jgi:DNA-binding response OmpR family regulator